MKTNHWLEDFENYVIINVTRCLDNNKSKSYENGGIYDSSFCVLKQKNKNITLQELSGLPIPIGLLFQMSEKPKESTENTEIQILFDKLIELFSVDEALNFIKDKSKNEIIKELEELMA